MFERKLQIDDDQRTISVSFSRRHQVLVKASSRVIAVIECAGKFNIRSGGQHTIDLHKNSEAETATVKLPALEQQNVSVKAHGKRMTILSARNAIVMMIRAVVW